MSEEAFFFKYTRSVQTAKENDPQEFWHAYGKFYSTA